MPIKPKTPAEVQGESRARWDSIQQMEAGHAEQRRIKQAEQEAQEQRILAAKRERERVVADAEARGEEPPPIQRPASWDDHYAQLRQEELAAQAQAEAERIAALTPRDIWLTTLPWAERERVSKWEAVNKGQKYPIPLSALNAIKAAQAAEQETP